MKIINMDGKPLKLGIKEGKRLLKRFPKDSPAYKQLKERIQELKKIITTQGDDNATKTN